LYTNGNIDENVRDYVSIYLINNNNNFINENYDISANFVIYMRNYKDINKFKAEKSSFLNNDGKSNKERVGFLRFMKTSDLYSSDSLIEDRKVIIGTYIKVFKKESFPIMPVVERFKSIGLNDSEASFVSSPIPQPQSNFIYDQSPARIDLVGWNDNYEYQDESTFSNLISSPITYDGEIYERNIERENNNQKNNYTKGKGKYTNDNYNDNDINNINLYIDEEKISPYERKEKELEEWDNAQIACIDGDIDKIRMFIAHRFDLSKKTENGWSLLHIATYNNNYEVVKCLLDNNMNKDIEKDGITPIYIASQNGFFDIVRLLVERGANFEKPTDGWYPIQMACNNGHINVVNYLLDKGANPSINNSEEGNYNILHIAVEKNDIKMVKFLLNKRRDLNVKAKGMSILHMASRKNQYEMVEYLISNRYCYIDEDDISLNTSLHIACENNCYKTAEVLLRYHANINAVNASYSTPLHIACEYDNLNIVKLLVENGADINANSDEGTPIYCSVYRSNTNIVKYLLTLNPKIDNMSKLKSIAKTINNIEIENALNRYITEKNIQLPKPLSRTSSTRSESNSIFTIDTKLSIIKAVKENSYYKTYNAIQIDNRKGCNFINQFDENCWTALHWACYNGNLEIVKLLLDNGAKTRYKTGNGIKGFEGKTAKEIAKLRGFKDIKKKLKYNIFKKRFNKIVDVVMPGLDIAEDAVGEKFVKPHVDALTGRIVDAAKNTIFK